MEAVVSRNVRIEWPSISADFINSIFDMKVNADGLARQLQEYAALVGNLDYCELNAGCCRADFVSYRFSYPLVQMTQNIGQLTNELLLICRRYCWLLNSVRMIFVQAHRDSFARCGPKA